MKKNKKINIWVIVFSLIAVVFVGTLIWNSAVSPTDEISKKKFKIIMEDRIKIWKGFDVKIQDLKNKIENPGDATPQTQNEWQENLNKLKIDKARDKIKLWSYSGSDVTYISGSLTDDTKDGKEIQKFSLNYFKVDKDDFLNKLTDEENVKAWTNVPFTLSSILNVQNVIFVLFVLGGFYLFSRLINRQGFGKEFKGTEFKTSSLRFSDVAGVETEKKELMEIVDFLKFPKKYIEMGARIPKGLLLFGPPGTGKTLLAKAVSGESGVPFFSISGSEFEEVFVGLGASRVREIFKKAKKEAPCIIFVDEIDSLGSRRNNIGNTSDQTLNQFLSAMDGFDTSEGIVIIGATNRLEVLDPALLRSGRFDRKINIVLPDIKEREAILKLHARKKKVNPKINFSSIAEKTPGFSGAELENTLNEAALLAVRKNKNIIDSNDISEGIDRVIAGPAKIGKIINEKTKILFSIHEAGHALLGLVLDDAMKVQKVTIIPRGNAGGYTITTPKDETLMYTKKTLIEKLAGLLGGRCAEEFIFGKENITTGAYDDFAKATQIAEKMVKKFGMSDVGIRNLEENVRYFGQKEQISEKLKKDIDHEIKILLDIAAEKARESLSKEFNLLFLISESLLILETITSEDVEYIHKERKLPLKALQKKQETKKKYLNFDFFADIPGKEIYKKYIENKKD